MYIVLPSVLPDKPVVLPISYEKQYAEEVTLKANEQSSSDRLKEASSATPVSKDEVKETKSETKGSSSKIEQDLDVFLLGDLGSEDDGPGVLLNPISPCSWCKFNCPWHIHILR